jgi:chemotaxis protein histidine kinase CheA
LRRAFHTLKGSSRMVGLTEFGEAAWAMEQMLNTWLAEQKPASDDLRAVCGEAMRQFSRWVEDIATGAATRTGRRSRSASRPMPCAWTTRGVSICCRRGPAAAVEASSRC